MPYNDAILNEADRQKVAALGQQWNEYNAAGNTAAAEQAHAQAEAIRNKYGYSGGADGSQYIYTGQNTQGYGDAGMQNADRERIEALGQQYRHYTALGDTAAAQNAHTQAEEIRAKYGYSGGASGSEYIPIAATSVMLRDATDQSGRINDVYDKNYDARVKALESAYNLKNMDYDQAEAKIAPVYDTQRNDLETQFQIARHNMGERAAANGINSGTGTQIALSQQNEYLRDYGALNKAEAQARSDLAFERAKASAAYRDAVAQALADNDVERAKALYEEAVRVDNSMVAVSQAQSALDLQREATEWQRKKEQADTLAQFGDFSGYAALGYTEAEIAQMRTVWAAENPLLAAAIGIPAYTGVGYSGGGGGGRSYHRSSGGGSGSSSSVQGPGNGSASSSAGTDSWVSVRGAGRMSWQEVSNGLKNGTIQATNTGGYKYVGKK